MEAVTQRMQMAESRVLVPHLGGRQRETTCGLSSSCFNVDLYAFDSRYERGSVCLQHRIY